MSESASSPIEQTSGQEIELISDGDGIAILGPPVAVDRFLISQKLDSQDLGLHRLGSKINAASGFVQAGSEITANSGRWVKLTKESAELSKKLNLMKGSTGDVSRAVVTEKGKIKAILEFSKGSLLTNPAVLAGAAGIMAQMAMQQTMDEITDYLAVIDAKVDDVLRAQKDAALAEMIGVEFVLEEAMTIRTQVGRVSEVTWSKVQTTSTTIASTQAYALRQLDAVAEKLEKTSKVGDLAKTAKTAETQVEEWLVVLARCFQLQTAIGILELDRVLDSSPAELDQHRIALKTAHHNRRTLITQTTEGLIARMDAVVGQANTSTKVLLSPLDYGALVQSSNNVAADVVEFHKRLGIEQNREPIEARRWVDAAAEVRDTVLEASAEGLGTAVRVGGEAITNVRVVTGRLGGAVSGRLRRDSKRKPQGDGQIDAPHDEDE